MTKEWTEYGYGVDFDADLEKTKAFLKNHYPEKACAIDSAEDEDDLTEVFGENSLASAVANVINSIENTVCFAGFSASEDDPERFGIVPCYPWENIRAMTKEETEALLLQYCETLGIKTATPDYFEQQYCG